ncbi:MAG TPA: heavy metal-binding domain-containing protein [bacterium]|jgi:hypothetical protein|nr:heavy metal-binding domain-containing protein [bacterium]
MKRLMSLLMGAALLAAVQPVWADDMGKVDGISPPGIGATPVTTPIAKVKKNKKPKKKAVQAVWVCPMGDYSGPKTADGKCPKCGMDLVEKK